MRRSCRRLGGFFNVKGKPGEKLTEKQQLLKEDLERPYFKDMHDLKKDPNGKLFEAQSFVGAHRMERLELLDKNLLNEKGEKVTFSAEEIRNNVNMVFIVHQMGFYASPYANEWKKRILYRFPKLHDRIYSVEIQENKVGYKLLRWLMKNQVRENWCKELQEGEEKEDRAGRLLCWKETRKNKMETRKLKKALGVDLNKYIPFVFLVQEQGLISFKAVGRPKKSEMDLFSKCMNKKT